MTLDPTKATWVYPVLTSLGLIALFFFPTTKHIARKADRRTYYLLQAITLLGALLGAKISALVGDFGWPWRSAIDWEQLRIAGRSITGGLIGGLLAAEAVKPMLGYTLPPNDFFALRLPFCIAFGRCGCLLRGCCRGAPHDGWLSVTYTDDGVARHPAQLFEILFQLALGALFVALVRRRLAAGRVFASYMIAYGAFRFLAEFWRDTPKYLLGRFSGFQLLSLLMLALGSGFFALRTPGLIARFGRGAA